MHFLRFPDEAAYHDAVELAASQGHGADPRSIDVIGAIYEEGEYDQEGNVVTPAIAKPGFHVNYLGTLPPAFEPYVIERPATPYRVFLGY